MLQSLEKSWCVTDIMAACLPKITSLKAWLVMSWPVRADFESVILSLKKIHNLYQLIPLKAQRWRLIQHALDRARRARKKALNAMSSSKGAKT